MSKSFLDVGRRTDVGRVRSHNEDSFAIREPEDEKELLRSGRMYLVADGMGGHSAGDVASTAAVQTIIQAYFNQQDPADWKSSLAASIKAANDRIRELADRPGQQGMGTTVVAAAVRDSHALVANVGDSRCYLIRDGKIRQISQDHSWVAEAIAAGHLTPAQARVHPRRNAITRSVGTRSEVTADLFEEEFKRGDVLVLCSDGLCGQVTDDVILSTVKDTAAQKAADKLVELANAAGGPDNITVVVVRNGPPPLRSRVPVGLVALAASCVALSAIGALSAFAMIGPNRNAISQAILQQGPAATETVPALLEGTQQAGGSRGPTSTPAPDSTATPTPDLSTATRTPTSRPVGGGAATTVTATPTRQATTTLTGPAIPSPVRTQPPPQPTPVNTPSFFVATNTPMPSPPPRPSGGGDDDGGGVDRR